MVHFDKKMIRRFDFGGTYTYWKQLELNKSGKLIHGSYFGTQTCFYGEAWHFFRRSRWSKISDLIIAGFTVLQPPITMQNSVSVR